MMVSYSKEFTIEEQDNEYILRAPDKSYIENGDKLKTEKGSCKLIGVFKDHIKVEYRNGYDKIGYSLDTLNQMEVEVI